MRSPTPTPATRTPAPTWRPRRETARPRSRGRGRWRATGAARAAPSSRSWLATRATTRWRRTGGGATTTLVGRASLYHDHTRRTLCVAHGTSVAAPLVTHVCAWSNTACGGSWGAGASANLIRAPGRPRRRGAGGGPRVGTRGHSDSAGLRRELRAMGFGRPAPTAPASRGTTARC